MAGDAQRHDRADRRLAREGDLGEVLGAGHAAALDQAVTSAADLAVQVADQRGFAGGAQAGGARLDHVARSAAASARPACRARAEREDVQEGQAGLLHQLQRVLEHLVGLGREAGDQVGAEGGVRAARRAPRPPASARRRAGGGASCASGSCRRRPAATGADRASAAAPPPRQRIRSGSISAASMDDSRRRGRSGTSFRIRADQLAQRRLRPAGRRPSS